MQKTEAETCRDENTTTLSWFRKASTMLHAHTASNMLSRAQSPRALIDSRSAGVLHYQNGERDTSMLAERR